MSITYRTNGVMTTASMTEWYFGKKFVSNATRIAKAAFAMDGKHSMKFWQDGTGYLTIEIH